MKTLYHVIMVVAFINLLAMITFAGWLYGTDRVDGDRLWEVKEKFAETIAEQKTREDEESTKAEAVRLEAERMARLSGVGGVASTSDQLEVEQERNEILLRQLERTRREIQSLQDNLLLSRQRMERRSEELVEQSRQLEARLNEIEARFNDDGFKRTVVMFETLPSKQVKQMFLDLMENGKTDQVVAYLQAMQSRKAAGVLKEFKNPVEIQRAVELTEKLRQQGSRLVEDVEQLG